MLHGVSQIFAIFLICSPALRTSASPSTTTTTTLACRQQCIAAHRTTPNDDVIKSLLTWTKMIADECMRACDEEYVSAAVQSAIDGANETDDKREDSSLAPLRRESKFLRIGRDTSAAESFFPTDPKAKPRRPPYLRIGRGVEQSSFASLMDEQKRAPSSRYVRIGRGGDSVATGEEDMVDATPYGPIEEGEDLEESEVMSAEDNADRGSTQDLGKRSPSSRYVRIGRGGDLEDEKRAPSSRYVRIGRGGDFEKEEEEVEKRARSSRYVCTEEEAINSNQKGQKKQRTAPAVESPRMGSEQTAAPVGSDSRSFTRGGPRSFTRIGRGDEEEKRASKYIRIGRGDESETAADKKASPSKYVRIGRGDDDRNEDIDSNNIERLMTHSTADANPDLFKRNNGYAPPRKQSKYIKIGKRLVADNEV